MKNNARKIYPVSRISVSSSDPSFLLKHSSEGLKIQHG